MKLVEDNAGMLPGETCHIPVCRRCGCRNLFKQAPGATFKLKNCPQCGHKINWNHDFIKT